MDTLAAALAFDRSLRIGAARQTATLPHGVVILHDRLPAVYHLNSVMLDAPLSAGLDAGGIARLADRWLAHRRHRHVVLDDAAAAEALAPDFARAGWSVQRTVMMALEADPDRTARPGVAREVDPATLRTLELLLSNEDPPFGAGLGFGEMIVQSMDALRDGARVRCFGAGENGGLVAACTLFLERTRGGTALLDNVGTLRQWRCRGFARAVVTAAIDEARANGCDPIVIPADADDWPKELYKRMGFRPLGMQVAFTLARAS